MPAETTEFTPLLRTFIYFSIAVALLVYGWLFHSLYRYRARPETPEPSDAPRVGHFPAEREDRRLEAAMFVGPLLLVIILTGLSLRPLDNLWDAPEDTVIIEVEASQWVWTFTYPDGSSSPELRVSRDQPVELEMTSTDVLHSLWIPELAVKEDIVPGETTHMWFDPADLEPGEYQITCTEYCGRFHSQMTAKLVVEA